MAKKKKVKYGGRPKNPDGPGRRFQVIIAAIDAARLEREQERSGLSWSEFLRRRVLR